MTPENRRAVGVDLAVAAEELVDRICANHAHADGQRSALLAPYEQFYEETSDA